MDSIVTDPPYGLGTREPSVQEIIAYLQGGDMDHGGDFMGRDWQIPSVAVWQECFRVLKPGGHVLAFGGTRTYDLISLGLRAAGFENRDTVASHFGVTVLEWIQGQGFPKSASVSKALEKLGLSPDEIKKWAGWGTNLKPSWEPILVFRKPIQESTIAKQVLKTGTGALNIDACRIGTQTRTNASGPGKERNTMVKGMVSGTETEIHNYGRWPANILLTHSPGCKQVGTQKVDAPVINRFTDGAKPFGNGAGHAYESEQQGDAEGKEEIAVYSCEPGCPVKVLGDQSGELKSGGGDKASSNKAWSGGWAHDVEQTYEADTGTAARFFGQFEAEAPFIYSPKVSKAERDQGLPKGTNKHPTVKPQKVMQWLVKLVTPKGGTVLDPYCGSGSTGVAALKSGCNFIGIERDPEFHAVSIQRVGNAAPQPDVFDLMGE